MNKKQIIIALSGALMLNISSGVMAGHRDNHARYDYAKVTNVEPLYRTVRINTPRQECWDEERVNYNQGYRSGTPMIIGGLIGGALGHQIGKGRGKDVATVAGALLGGSIARDVQQKNSGGRTNTYFETVCRTVDDYHTEERIEGYRVSYKYRGQIYTSRMDREPGKRVRVRVRVSLAE